MCGGGNGKRAIAGGRTVEGEVVCRTSGGEVVVEVATGKGCVFEISIYICVQISCLCGGVHVNSY